MKSPVIVLGSDHAGFPVKKYVKSLLEKMGRPTQDVGTYDSKRVDYPEYAEKVALGVLKGEGRRGILSCGTGIGASIAANKIPGIRAALVNSVEEARLSRQHNDANVLILGGWGYNRQLIRRILNVWLKTRALKGRHSRRVKKIARLEKKYLTRRSSGRSV
jgi:ribose 5-phosphate isomerase B